MNEQQGVDVLRGVFEARGFSIQANHPLTAVDPALPALRVDGLDVARRVGFEWITGEAGDRAELTPAVVAALDEAIAAGRITLLLVDEADVTDPAELRRIGERFLDGVAARGRA